MMWNLEPPQRTHMVDRLQLKNLQNEHKSVPQEMLYIVLVVTIIDPSLSHSEFKEDACAGTLLRKHLVLTTASCLIHTSQEHPNAGDTAVRTRYDKRLLHANKIYLHPDYTRAEGDYNVAIVDLINHSAIKTFPKLPDELFKFSDIITTCQIGGYGKLIRLGVSNFNYLNLTNSLVTEFECRRKSDHRFCLHFNSFLPCNGDVGSPIICNDELYAIFTPSAVIYPEICMERYGATFVMVYKVKDWIDRIISIPQISLEWMNNPVYILLLCGTVLTVIGGIYYVIMEWLQKTFEPLGVQNTQEDEEEGEDETVSEWIKK